MVKNVIFAMVLGLATGCSHDKSGLTLPERSGSKGAAKEDNKNGDANAEPRSYPVANIVILENSLVRGDANPDEPRLIIAVYGEGSLPLSRILWKVIGVKDSEVKSLREKSQTVPPKECGDSENYAIAEDKIITESCRIQLADNAGFEDLTANCQKETLSIDLRKSVSLASEWLGLCVLAQFEDSESPLWQPYDEASWYVFPNSETSKGQSPLEGEPNSLPTVGATPDGTPAPKPPAPKLPAPKPPAPAPAPAPTPAPAPISTSTPDLCPNLLIKDKACSCSSLNKRGFGQIFQNDGKSYCKTNSDYQNNVAEEFWCLPDPALSCTL